MLTPFPNPLSNLWRSRQLFWRGTCVLLFLGLIGCTSTPPIATAPSSFEEALALHLSQTGAVMYGAYWCPHCESQKDAFGTATPLIPYVECDPQGENAEPERCTAAQIEGYPTWVIGSQTYPGVQSLQDLATLSGYPGEIPAATGDR